MRRTFLFLAVLQIPFLFSHSEEACAQNFAPVPVGIDFDFEVDDEEAMLDEQMQAHMYQHVRQQKKGPNLQPALPPIGETLPTDANQLSNEADDELAAIQKKADEEKRKVREQTIAALQQLQDKYTREAKLDEAIAIRDRIRRLKLAEIQLYRDPGNLQTFQEQVGKSFYFEVTGSTEGNIWGTDVYSFHSTLAKAAVHSGALRPGQKGVLKVTITSAEQEYEGSSQYGVVSQGFRRAPFSFTVDPWSDTPAKAKADSVRGDQ